MKSVNNRKDKRRIADDLVERGLYKEAREIYSELLQEEPENAHLLALRGYTSYRLDDPAPAIADFDAALIIKEDSPNTIFLRAKCKELVNDLESAILDYRKVLSLAPATADAHSSIAMIMEFRGDIPAARREHRKALQIDPDAGSSTRFFQKHGD